MPEARKTVKVLKSKPTTIFLLAMTLWWLIPFFARDLLGYPLLSHLRSHLLYFVTFSMATLFALLVGYVDRRSRFWKRYAYWGRYLIISGLYALQMILIVLILSVLDYWNLLRYFGGDAGGSVGFLFLPSILFYWIAGAFLGLLFQTTKSLRGRNHHGASAERKGR